MRIAYLDCFSGISGDMFLGAVVDAGVSPELLQQTVAALAVHLGSSAELEISKVDRSGISATKVDVLVDGKKDEPRVEHDHGDHKHGHTHEHAHERIFGDDPGHEHHGHEQHTHEQPGPRRQEKENEVGLLKHNFPRIAAIPESMRRAKEAQQEHGHGHGGGHGRHLKEIKQIISKAKLTAKAKQTATRIFEVLGAAEAKVHNIPVEEVHFHEVGAVDAIVDIVCAAVGAEALGVDEWVASPLNVGSGTVECAHGTFPVPAPATVELLSGALIYSSGLEAELVTPTGAAIVRALVSRFEPMPAMQITKTGYGAGTRDFHKHANVLRITVGEFAGEVRAGGGTGETIAVLEANLDDLNPQLFGYVMERALAAGALDVFATPVQMKKNRPGMLLTVLAKPADADKLTKLLFSETTTLGVRNREEKRATLARRSVEVKTPWGVVRMKVANLNGTVSNYAPEYEDCRRIATESGVPLKRVMQEAMSAYATLADKSSKKKK
ncbi:MAG: nickel pincer cofactor biosynthesis protein LarC [Acidobacteriota bacterium]|nr:nickel pincer cofactor biosynthesis protein LarC [Acidobacteriota bacterium]